MEEVALKTLKEILLGRGRPNEEFEIVGGALDETKMYTYDSLLIIFSTKTRVTEREFNNFLEPLLKKDVDMFFMKENDTTVNVGFMVLRNNNKVRNFFTNVIQELESLTTPLLDQTVINNLLKTFEGRYEVLDEKYIASNVNVDLHDKEVVKSICIFQPLCTANKNYKLNILEKLISFQYLFNINLNNYITDLSETLEGEDKAVFEFILSHYTSISSLES